MPRNVIITPASGLIDFKDDAGNIDAFIQLDGSGNLNIANSGGNLSLGNTATDVYIGDGVNSVDIVFEQNGDIRALAGRTLTLGQSDSNITVASPTIFTSTSVSTSTTTGALKVSGGVGVAGALNAASVKVNNLYTLPTADGTSGQVITTNGAGQLQFSTSSTVGGYDNSSLTSFPSGDYQGTDTFVGSSGNSLDAFGVSLLATFTCMDPIGSTQTTDLGVLT